MDKQVVINIMIIRKYICKVPATGLLLSDK